MAWRERADGESQHALWYVKSAKQKINGFKLGMKLQEEMDGLFRNCVAEVKQGDPTPPLSDDEAVFQCYRFHFSTRQPKWLVYPEKLLVTNRHGPPQIQIKSRPI